ncbi:MAG TPA: tetratricopeptide repeat protein [Brevefilum sp.]|nr:tetratricopeptide repeat protein [Brevefilum sp.]HOR20029.1 tetratricopeptide repeat protein [Brevefilum sp.]HPL69849.1 tetratricopeptide repeat protein [Brevefilum sp.]
MRKLAPILLLLSIALISFSFPAFENNLWSVTFVKGFKSGLLTPEQLTTAPKSHPHARVLQARVAMSEQDDTFALQVIEALVPTNDPVTLQTYAELLFSLERYTEALDIWHSLGMYNKIEHAANALRTSGNSEMAIYALEKAYDIRPDIYARSLQYAQLERANKTRDAGQILESIPLYQAIIDQFPDYVAPYGDLALAYLEQGEPNLALSTLDKAMPKSSADYRFYMRAGNIYDQCGSFDRALEAYQKALLECSNCQDAVQAIDRLINP